MYAIRSYYDKESAPMRKISTFITAVNLAIFFAVFGVFAVLATSQAAYFIQDDTQKLLKEWTDSWGSRIETAFGETFARTDVFRSYLEETIDKPTMADPKRLMPYFMGLQPMATGLIRRFNTLDYYSYNFV